MSKAKGHIRFSAIWLRNEDGYGNRTRYWRPQEVRGHKRITTHTLVILSCSRWQTIHRRDDGIFDQWNSWNGHVFYRNLAICLLWPLIDDIDFTVARYVEIEFLQSQLHKLQMVHSLRYTYRQRSLSWNKSLWNNLTFSIRVNFFVNIDSQRYYFYENISMKRSFWNSHFVRYHYN